MTNRITIPRQMKGKKVALQLSIGGEACVFINSIPYNGLDKNRSLIYLTECAQGDESYDVEIEAYSKDLIIDSSKRFLVDLVITESNLVSIAQPIYNFYFDCSICAEYVEHVRRIPISAFILCFMMQSECWIIAPGETGRNLHWH